MCSVFAYLKNAPGAFHYFEFSLKVWDGIRKKFSLVIDLRKANELDLLIKHTCYRHTD